MHTISTFRWLFWLWDWIPLFLSNCFSSYLSSPSSMDAGDALGAVFSFLAVINAGGSTITARKMCKMPSSSCFYSWGRRSRSYLSWRRLWKDQTHRRRPHVRNQWLLPGWMRCSLTEETKSSPANCSSVCTESANSPASPSPIQCWIELG
jgi:hypothetical protein